MAGSSSRKAARRPAREPTTTRAASPPSASSRSRSSTPATSWPAWTCAATTTAAKPRYDLIVAPGADPKSIKLGFRGADGLSVDKGALKIGTQLGGFTNGKPFAYQTIAGKQKAVPVRWVVKNGKTATFALGAYDHSSALVIDPVVYGTYFGGDDGGDEVRAITSNTVAGGNNGSVLLTGSTRAVGFPTSTGFNNYNNPTGDDAFVSRLQGDAYNRDYAVFVGGRGVDTGQYIKLDAEGNVWIAGTTTSPQFYSTGRHHADHLADLRDALHAAGQRLPSAHRPPERHALRALPVRHAERGGLHHGLRRPEDAPRPLPISNTTLVLSGIALGATVAGQSPGQAIELFPDALPTGQDETGYVARINYSSPCPGRERDRQLRVRPRVELPGQQRRRGHRDARRRLRQHGQLLRRRHRLRQREPEHGPRHRR